jgi:hypothetical protein
MKKYSVLTFNLGGYEIIHEIPKEAINQEIEYIYVTDDETIKSDTWTIVYEHNLKGSIFDKCMQIRYDPFKYVSTNVVMKIDGSIKIEKDLYPIFQKFDDGGYHCAVCVHPERDTMFEEYAAWCELRNYLREHSEKVLKCMEELGYDIYNYRGLYQTNFAIQRNDFFNNLWNKIHYCMSKMLATPPETIERADQTINSFVLNKFFDDRNVMVVASPQIYNGEYLNFCNHRGDEPFMLPQCIEPYAFNAPANLVDI